MLEMKDVCASYGASHVLFDVNLNIREGELVTIIGSNGAGKSTIIKTICGWLKPTSGEIILDGEDVTGLPTQELARRGIAVSPEGRRVFHQMTVFENLEIGAYTKKNRSDVEENLEFVYTLFPKLKERSRQAAGSLSGGEQQMLAIGRALMSSPRLVLLDEPSLGLAPLMVEIMLDTVKEINKERGVTVCLVEQNAQLALQMADRGYVLETGSIAREGTGIELLHDDKIKEIYLGF